MVAGVYVIINTVTGEEYIGKSANIEQRWREHGTQLRTGHGARTLQKAWDTYGEAVFVFQVLEACADLRQMNEAEARYIAERQPAYNSMAPYQPGERRQVVTMTWPVDLAQRIEAVARERDLSKTELVIVALREWLAMQ